MYWYWDLERAKDGMRKSKIKAPIAKILFFFIASLLKLCIHYIIKAIFMPNAIWLRRGACQSIPSFMTAICSIIRTALFEWSLKTVILKHMAKAKWFENRLNGSSRVIRRHAAFVPARQKRFGFRLRSPLPSVEEPCPLSLQTAFSSLCLRPGKSGVFSNHLA